MRGCSTEPQDKGGIIVERGIPENDEMPWIIENGERDTIIVERGPVQQ